jgi:hypothetical protein
LKKANEAGEVKSAVDEKKAAPSAAKPNRERTFLMLKPDAVQRGLAGQIIGRFEQKGFKLVAMKLMRASVDLLGKHYADLSKKPFFPELIRYTSGFVRLEPRCEI